MSDMKEEIQNCDNCNHLKKKRGYKGEPYWVCELMEKARTSAEDGEFFCKDYEEIQD